MRVKNEHEIKALAKESAGEPLPDKDLIAQWKCYVGGYEKGYSQAQQDLLSQASEGFEEWLVGYFALEGSNDLIEDVNTQNIEYAELVEAWQDSSLANAKKMQEKDAEIERLRKENERLKHELACGVRIINDLKEELKSKDKDVGQDLKNVLNNVFKAIKEDDEEEVK